MKSKIGAGIFALLFAVGFGAGGFFGLSNLARQLNGWWQARDWQAASAMVLETDLVSSRGETTTYRATARYRYEFHGRSYEGTRVGFTSGSDNVGSWQQDRYRELIAAHRANVPIRVWVNPNDPTQSIVDRNLRPAMIAFSVPFATLFPAIAIGALWFFVRTLRAPAAADGAPALERNPTKITSDARAGVLALWLFASFWGLIAFPLAFIFIPQQIGRSWVWLFVLLFPLIGIALIWLAARRTFQLLRNGRVTIELLPAQPRLGEQLTVHASFARTPAAGIYRCSLVCEHVDSRGDSTSTRTIWRQEREIEVHGQAATVSFSPPSHLPATEPTASVHHRWHVQLSFPDGKDERDFKVVMHAARPGAAMANEEENDATSDEASASAIPPHIAVVVEEPAKLTIDYNPENARAGAVGILIAAMIFGGIGAFLLFGTAHGVFPKVMGLLFASVGIACLGGCIYAMTHRRMVSIADGRFHITDRWLFQSKQFQFPITELRKLEPSITGTTSVGNKRYDHHRIKALLKDGRRIVVASNVRDEGAATTLLTLMRRRVREQGHATDTGTRSSAMSMDSADAARNVRRVKLAVQTLSVLLFVAFAWDFATPFFASHTPPTATNLEVEAPRASPAASISRADRSLFDAIGKNRGLDAVTAALLDGANVNVLNEWGATPLLVAARIGDPGVVKHLISTGADVNFSVSMDNEYRGRTPLMHAATGHGGAIVEILLDAGAIAQRYESHGWSALHYAARRGDLGALRAFHRHGVDLDLASPVNRGETPLMIAARFGRLDSIEVLIALGADPRVKDRHGENVYGWAKYFNQPAAMEALSEYR